MITLIGSIPAGFASAAKPLSTQDETLTFKSALQIGLFVSYPVPNANQLRFGAYVQSDCLTARLLYQSRLCATLLRVFEALPSLYI